MSITPQALKSRPECFLRMTGVSIEVFEKIALDCTPLWEDTLIKTKHLPGRPYGLPDIEMHLLGLLLYYRCYTTQLYLGFLFNVSESCICRSIKRLEPILAKTVALKKDRTMTQEELEDMIIDCTEQPIQRPKKKQKKYYSGKKKRHTIKTELRIRGDGKILSTSPPTPGKVHDFNIYKAGKPPPPRCRVYADSGYQGLDKKHKQTEIPFKKPKRGKLTPEEKEYNHALSSYRVRVEHKIGELKVFKILSDTYRNFRKGYGLKMNIVTGIVNIKNGF